MEWDSKATARTWTYGGNNKPDSRIEHTADVNIDRRAVIVMCADNGIVEESVTQTGQEVTAIVSCNMADGISSVCRMAAYANADVIPVNVGIAMDTLEDGTDVGTYKGLVNKRVMSGTNNFLKEPAMSEEQLIQAIYAGITQVKECKEQKYNILCNRRDGNRQYNHKHGTCLHTFKS